ncbi:DUF411 domain-containing protein [Aureimonas psammosilenae]|uniref:DUF411 domain-containing protein n=1 Tax=Aureimonas psammosilenae TaxID=2495496 RepID=UPI001260415F|nr:DUF411 domain-containing protein [Aureimonas psammosilenae]
MLPTKPLLAALAFLALAVPAAADHAPKHMHVFKSPECGCCGAWVEIARKHGFEVTVEDREDMAGLKRLLGVSETVESYHTAKVGGYVVEGHVPMEAVDRLLTGRPQVAGIAAPGMPAGSPGMGDDPDARFDVLSFGKASQATAVFYRAGPR